MDETKRLELIAEAVRYCQRVKALDMPVACWTKAVREPVYFLWDLPRARNKDCAAKFRSRAARKLTRGDGELIFDHAVPFRYLQAELLALSDVTAESVKGVLLNAGPFALITKDEDVQLARAGYRSEMPEDWDRKDPLARYKAVGIEMDPNPDYTETAADSSSASPKRPQ